MPPPSCVHSRTYTGLPSTGNPLTVAARLVPCPWLYTLKLPAPVVPTEIKYCVAPAPALQLRVAVRPEERRLGKECRSPWRPDHYNTKGTRSAVPPVPP